MNRKEARLLNRQAWYKPHLWNIEHIAKRLSFVIIGKLVRTKAHDKRLSLDDVKSVLFLRHDALGDMVLSTPLWRSLKSRKPSIVIGVAGSKSNLELIRSDTDINHFYELGLTTSGPFWSEIRRARKEEWDLIVNLVYKEKTRGALIAWRISSTATRATSAFSRHDRYKALYSFVGSRSTTNPPLAMIEQVVETLSTALDLHISDEEKRPSLLLDGDILQQVRAKVHSTMLNSQANWSIHINTNSSAEYRDWGLENSLEASKQLLKKYKDLHIFWTASPSRIPAVERFLEVAAVKGISLFPTPTQQHLAALVRTSRLVISPDTSVVHIATAERKPIVGLYMELNEFLPYRVSNKVLLPGKDKPMKSIPVQAVVNAAIELLSELR